MQSPIYILCGGSLGLLYASAMRRSKSKVPIRLLLQQHHKNKVLRNESTNETFVSVKFEDVKGKQYIQEKMERNKADQQVSEVELEVK